MTPRQCEIAAESYTASLLAQCEYDISVQYGANQPQYDLIAVKQSRILLISVKGSQDGGWMLAVKYVGKGVGYHEAIDKWEKAQRVDLVYVLVQCQNVELNEAPRVYISRPPEIAVHMKTQNDSKGHGSLQEDWIRNHPKSKCAHKIPTAWAFSKQRIDTL